jgi:hypothetical protein
VRVHGVTAFNFLGVQATFASRTPQLDPGEPFYQLGGAVGQSHFYFVNVPPNTSKLSVHVSGGRTDLFLRLGGIPGLVDYDCAPSRLGRRNETCTVRYPSPGKWLVGLYDFADYTQAKVRAKLRVSQ